MISAYLLCAIIYCNAMLCHGLPQSAKPMVVVDVDAGVDDAIAILMLLESHKRGDIELKAITCVNGNTDLNNVTRNVLRILEAASTLDIPVYKGASSSLLLPDESYSKKEKYYGQDGFGDLQYGHAPNPRPLQPEHAVIALHRIVSQHPNKVTVIFLGPLTNAALAIKMFPTFLDLVEDIFVMGGNYMGVGNLDDASEFNFGTDPEAALILLSEVKKPIKILPLETRRDSDKITLEWRFNVMGAIDNPQMRLMNEVEKQIFARHPNVAYRAYDPTTVAIMLNPKIVKHYIETHASVELSGKLTRGQMIIDHVSKRNPNVILVTEIDEDLLKEMLLFAAGHKN